MWTWSRRRGQVVAVQDPAELRRARGLAAHLCRPGHRPGLGHRARLPGRHAGCALGAARLTPASAVLGGWGAAGARRPGRQYAACATACAAAGAAGTPSMPTSPCPSASLQWRRPSTWRTGCPPMRRWSTTPAPPRPRVSAPVAGVSQRSRGRSCTASATQCLRSALGWAPRACQARCARPPPATATLSVPTRTARVPPASAENPALYRHLVERLAAVLDLRAASDPKVGDAEGVAGMAAGGAGLRSCRTPRSSGWRGVVRERELPAAPVGLQRRWQRQSPCAARARVHASCPHCQPPTTTPPVMPLPPGSGPRCAPRAWWPTPWAGSWTWAMTCSSTRYRWESSGCGGLVREVRGCGDGDGGRGSFASSLRLLRWPLSCTLPP